MTPEEITIKVLRENTYMSMDYAADTANKITAALSAAHMLNTVEAPNKCHS
jgi:hypothetical protein